MTDAKLFIDTNVLVYASIIESPFHQAARQALAVAQSHYGSLWISSQVIREFLVVLTRPQTFSDLPHDVVLRQVADFCQRFQIADDSAAVRQYLLSLIDALQISGKQIHDANIVATMQAYGIGTLLTHNTKDFQRFTPIISLEGIAL